MGLRPAQVWVDINGTEHEIESMPRDYVENVIGFCLRRAAWIYVLVTFEGAQGESGELEWAWTDGDDRMLMVHAADWLEGTRLMRALRRRLGVSDRT